jgi:hypothetical protein
MPTSLTPWASYEITSNFNNIYEFMVVFRMARHFSVQIKTANRRSAAHRWLYRKGTFALN